MPFANFSSVLCPLLLNAAEPHPNLIDTASSFLKTALPQANLEKEENAVESFLHKHADKITGSLLCPDRLIFKGYLTFSYPQGMENCFARIIQKET